MSKKELTISEFKEIIKEEALKLKKRVMLENEKRELELELESLIESMEYDNMDELFKFGGGDEKKEQALKDEFVKKSKAWGMPMSDEELNDLMAKAKEDNYKGRVANKGGKMAYRASTDKEMAGGFGGHSFGSGM